MPVQDHPAGAAMEMKVVLAGSGSESVANGALLGPALLTVIVYVRLLPAITGSGESAFVTDRSLTMSTGVSADALVAPSRPPLE